jgi:hypothetical protein
VLNAIAHRYKGGFQVCRATGHSGSLRRANVEVDTRFVGIEQGGSGRSPMGLLNYVVMRIKQPEPKVGGAVRRYRAAHQPWIVYNPRSLVSAAVGHAVSENEPLVLRQIDGEFKGFEIV